MEIIKIIGIGLVSLIIVIVIKQYKPEFALYVSIAAGLIIFLMVMVVLLLLVKLTVIKLQLLMHIHVVMIGQRQKISIIVMQ